MYYLKLQHIRENQWFFINHEMGFTVQDLGTLAICPLLLTIYRGSAMSSPSFYTVLVCVCVSGADVCDGASAGLGLRHAIADNSSMLLQVSGCAYLPSHVPNFLSVLFNILSSQPGLCVCVCVCGIMHAQKNSDCWPHKRVEKAR